MRPDIFTAGGPRHLRIPAAPDPRIFKGLEYHRRSAAARGKLRAARPGRHARRAAVLREALTRHVVVTLVQAQEHGPWQLDASAQPLAVGLADAESLLGVDLGWSAAQRLLAEWFSFPEKFNFLDLPLPAAARSSESRTLALHFALAGLRDDGEEVRLLRELSAADFLTNCVPVANLFEAEAEGQALPGRPGCYALRPRQDTLAQDIHAITQVRLQPKSGQRDPAYAADAGHAAEGWPIEPWCSLRYGAAPAWGLEAAAPRAWHTPPGGLYWIARREEAAPDGGAGSLVLELVDEAGDPVELPASTVQVRARAGNGPWAARLGVGHAGGELSCAGGGSWNAIRLLRPPTPARPLDLGQGMAWRLIALLSCWFAQSARRDSFIRLHLVSADTRELLMSCPRQNGEMPLI